jgi:serine/threonine protein kinase
MGFDEYGVVCIFDFGLAREADAQGQIQHMTGAAGTPGYMSPECAKSESCSFPSDVCSFAILFWEILTLDSRNPLNGSNCSPNFTNRWCDEMCVLLSTKMPVCSSGRCSNKVGMKIQKTVQPFPQSVLQSKVTNLSSSNSSSSQAPHNAVVSRSLPNPVVIYYDENLLATRNS